MGLSTSWRRFLRKGGLEFLWRGVKRGKRTDARQLSTTPNISQKSIHHDTSDRTLRVCFSYIRWIILTHVSEIVMASKYDFINKCWPLTTSVLWWLAVWTPALQQTPWSWTLPRTVGRHLKTFRSWQTVTSSVLSSVITNSTLAARCCWFLVCHFCDVFKVKSRTRVWQNTARNQRAGSD